MSHTDQSRQAPVLHLEDVTRVHGQGAAEVQALRGVDLKVHPGEFVAVNSSVSEVPLVAEDFDPFASTL